MKPFIPLSLLALAPLLHAGDACCPDDGKFDAKPASAHAEAGHDHAHEHESANPRVTLKANQVANLAIKSVKIGPAKIARTAFSLGDIDADPRGESSAASRIAGRIVELKVALGDTVKKGDTLALVESRQSGGEPARIAITALADGTVTEVRTRLGEPVSPDAPLLRLADHTRLVAEARIPQRYAAELKPGVTRVRFTPEGGVERELTLDSLAPIADPVAGTVTARFRIDNTDGALTPGRRAEFRVILAEKEFPVTVPRASVQGEKGDLFVFIEEKPGVYEKHPVLLGEGDERTVAVTGPEAGEMVVTHGAYSLRYSDASNVSLREAMDAAHGHKHGPNGEEPEGEDHDHAGHTHEHAEPGNAGVSPTSAHDHDDHAGDGHDDHDHAGHTHADAPSTGKTALQAELDAAHGHAHGPHGEELGEHTAAAKPGFLSGDSGATFFATLAAGEAILLGLALTALRRKQSKEVAGA